MNVLRSVPVLTWSKAALFIVSAVVCFHLAYWQTTFAPLHLAIIGYVICLAQLARLKNARQSFYAGMATAFFCIAPQLMCFWNIFGPAALVLWLILAFWIGAFTGLANTALKRFGIIPAAMLIPFFWMGLEYFRSELYYLKFSWLNVGYAFSGSELFPLHFLGMYGVGFLVAAFAALFLALRSPCAAGITAVVVVLASFSSWALIGSGKPTTLHIAGVQMEFPSEHDIPAALDGALAIHTNADLLVLSEYTLDGSVPDSLRNWCRTHNRYLVVGGKDPAPNNNFYDTAFVVEPTGEIVFRQVKSVPIQFFKDGLPAPEQKLWDSPWGKIGFCVCYDLSYTRVVDGLVREGAQLIIVPTMDVADWGEHQHQLHALVAPVRAEEYHVPIFRLASSGISQAVDRSGRTQATAPFPGQGEILFASFRISSPGSVPMDRLVAPVAVVVTGALFLFFCLQKKKSGAVTPEQSSQLAATANSAEK